MARTKQTARFSKAKRDKKSKRDRDNRSRSRSRSRSGERRRSRSPSQESHKSMEINTQQFSVKFDNQKDCQRNSVPLDVVQCTNCGAYLNGMSVITEKDSKKSIERNLDDASKQLYKICLRSWICQFCLTANDLPENFAGIPKENQCYLVQRSQQILNEGGSQKQNIILFCIDVSGSMDTHFQNKTRLEAVKEAICDEIKRMKVEKDDSRIAIITFGSKVSLETVTGSMKIPSQYYMDFQKIVQYSKTLTGFAFEIQSKFKDLKKLVEDLITYGSTALGPALVSAIQLASTGKKGSKIILCTDGQANVGLNGPQFYSRAAWFAKQKGVIVNILSIKGDNCNLKQLGKLTLSTGGSVLKIDPSLLGSQFNKISKQEILGSESNLKIIVNRAFEIQNAKGDLSKEKTVLRQDYGSFTADTELTFNFKVLTQTEANLKGVNYEHFLANKAPMQVQLTYTSPSGNKYLQVITDFRILSENQEEIMKDMNFGLFAASNLQKISALIKQENFQRADMEIKNYQRIVQQVFSKKQPKNLLDKFNKRVQQLEKILTSKKIKKSNPQTRRSRASKTKTKSKAPISKSRGRGRGSDRDRDRRSRERFSASQHSDEQMQEQDDVMLSDSEQVVLFREMRARSRSADRNDSD